MSNISGFELQDQVVRYLANRISLHEFRNWFDMTSWDTEVEPNSRLFAMIAEVELRLAEYSNDHWTEEELRDQLKSLVPDQIVLVETVGGPSKTVTGSSLRIEEQKVGKILSVGTRPSWASV